MSPEWIAALRQFLAHPELLVATFIGMSAAFSFAWWLRGHIDRAHIDTLKSRVDGRAFEQLKQRVEDLGRENEGLRAQIPAKVVLNDDTKRVLVHMYKTARGQEVSAMATALGMEISLLQYHLERLLQSGLADLVNLNYLEGKKYWALTRKGRQLVVEGKLI